MSTIRLARRGLGLVMLLALVAGCAHLDGAVNKWKEEATAGMRIAEVCGSLDATSRQTDSVRGVIRDKVSKLVQDEASNAKRLVYDVFLELLPRIRAGVEEQLSGGESWDVLVQSLANARSLDAANSRVSMAESSLKKAEERLAAQRSNQNAKRRDAARSELDAAKAALASEVEKLPEASTDIGSSWKYWEGRRRHRNAMCEAWYSAEAALEVCSIERKSMLGEPIDEGPASAFAPRPLCPRGDARPSSSCGDAAGRAVANAKLAVQTMGPNELREVEGSESWQGATATLAKLWRALQGAEPGKVEDLDHRLAKAFDFSEYSVLGAIYLANMLDERVDDLTASIPFGGGLVGGALSWVVGRVMGIIAYQLIVESERLDIPVSAIDTTRAACRHYTSGASRPASTMSMLRGIILRYDGQSNVPIQAAEADKAVTPQTASFNRGLLAYVPQTTVDLEEMTDGADGGRKQRRVKKDKAAQTREPLSEEDLRFCEESLGSRELRCRNLLRKVKGVSPVKVPPTLTQTYELPDRQKLGEQAVSRLIAFAEACPSEAECTRETFNAQVSVGLAVEAASKVHVQEESSKKDEDEQDTFKPFDNGCPNCCRPAAIQPSPGPSRFTELLVDRSATMLDESKWDKLTAVLIAFLQQLESTHSGPGMIRAFATRAPNDSCAYDEKIVPMTVDGVSLLPEPPPNADTLTGTALRSALQFMKGHPPGSSVILVTDGVPDCPNEPQGNDETEAARALDVAQTLYRELGVKVYVVGIGFCDGGGSQPESKTVGRLERCPAGYARIDATDCVSARSYIRRLARAGGTTDAYVAADPNNLSEALFAAAAARDCTMRWDEAPIASALEIGGQMYYRISSSDEYPECPAAESESDTEIPELSASEDEFAASADTATVSSQPADNDEQGPGSCTDPTTQVPGPKEPGWQYCAETRELRLFGDACRAYIELPDRGLSSQEGFRALE